MQIILVQSEIEKAITQFISSQMTISENVRVAIDLKATRGSEGFQATVDLVTIEDTIQEPTAAVPAPAPAAPVVRRPRVIAPATTPAPVAQAPAQEQQEKAAPTVGQSAPAEEPSEESPAAPTTTHPDDLPDAGQDAQSPSAPEDEQVIETVQAAPAAAAPRKSLFAGMARPVNK